MFTGIIQALGRVRYCSGGKLRLRAKLRGIAVGGSVAVDGVCLSVSRKAAGMLEFDLSPETLRRTNLGSLRPGTTVNLEPPLTLQDPLGGHLVSGHVDATAAVARMRPSPDGSVQARISLPVALGRYVVEKGSIAVDGISLTVVRVGPGYFETVLIPHTLSHTTLGLKKRGATVNLEADLLARYAQGLPRAPA